VEFIGTEIEDKDDNVARPEVGFKVHEEKRLSSRKVSNS